MKVIANIVESRIAQSGGGELVVAALCFPQAGETFASTRLELSTYVDGTENPTSLNSKILEAIQNACQNSSMVNNIRPSSQDVTQQKFQ